MSNPYTIERRPHATRLNGVEWWLLCDGAPVEVYPTQRQAVMAREACIAWDHGHGVVPDAPTNERLYSDRNARL